ncbi:MAG: SAM-dependent chlorinase/fluorinase [candidate division WOR-3 bacterium]
MKAITLLTDFGLKDPYVGIMKGVILSINPQVHVIDMSHDVEPQDVTEACFLVKEYAPFFRKGTIHLCVVDPTVGSERRAIVLMHAGQLFVGPDNGLFTLLFDAQSAVYEITNRSYMASRVSNTFHGRDIFAPVAAHLSLGLNPAALGKQIADPVHLSGVHPTQKGRLLMGHIIRFDRFGNAISNISADALNAFHKGKPFRVELGGLSFDRLNRTYVEDTYTCLEGSSGYIEFATFKGSIAQVKGIRKNDPVVVRLTSA